MLRNILLPTLALMICRWIFLGTDVVHSDQGIRTPSCLTGCVCCKNRNCGPLTGAFWADGNCYDGCIDGYRGARCGMKCRYPDCAACDDDASICTKCTNGYYPGPATNCSLKCPSKCKSCTSSTYCTECNENYYNIHGSTDCRYPYCPQNCKCENTQCLSCRDGYYNTSMKCNSKCPDNCFTCSSKYSCDTCKDGYFSTRGLDNFGTCTDRCRENCTTCSSYDQCLQCKPGKYGSACQNDCSLGCRGGTCVKISGNCNCTENYDGASCNECLAGRYGTFCEERCSEYCKHSTCNKTTGQCIDGCVSKNITGRTCNECISGLQGEFCNVACPENCKDYKCYRDSGECSSGCRSNSIGTKCEMCVDGKYGKTCDLTCPTNCKDGKCDKVLGICINCHGNFAGDKCENCKIGFYGQTCDSNCSSGCSSNTCGSETGECIDGCKDNFSGDKCCLANGNCYKCSSNTKCGQCIPGYFGTLCEKKCSPTCLESCEFQTGICYHCKKKYFGSFCNYTCSDNCTISSNVNERRCEETHGNCLEGCLDGNYGPWCNETCNSLCIDDICMQETGKCTKGCDGQHENPVCPLRSAKTGDPNITGPAAGGSLALVVVVAVIIAAVVFYKKRRLVKYSESQNADANIAKPEKKDQNVYENIGANRSLEDETVNQTLMNGPSAVVDIDDLKIDEHVDSEDDVDTDYYNFKHDQMRINVADLFSYVTSEHIDLFETDFSNLPKPEDLSKVCMFARKPENKALNRYNGIYPFDHSRVTIPDQPRFFINACYIDGYNRKKAYIASFGPTKKTTDQFLTFWCMVWHEKSDIIMMLTNLHEPSGMKCEQYWPEGDTEEHYGLVKVKCRCVEEFAEYTVRTFTISKEKEQRNLTQLHYTAWPDKGVPSEVTSLVELRQRAKTVPVVLDGPVIVHCSAGIGRTGTYIAIDILADEGTCERSVDVFNCVRRMREQRVNMVQTAEQYIFLHKALVHTLTFGCEAITAEEIQGLAFEADSKFKKLFKILKQEVDTEKEEDVAAREENRKSYADKSRRHSEIPGNRGRVRLYLRREAGDHNYINAVFISSFKIKTLFIAAQSPLSGTVEDFLCMIYQQNSSCVVALQESLQPMDDVGKYLPADNESYRHGDFTVTSSKLQTKPQYILKKLTIQHKGVEKDVYHFQYTKWGDDQKVADSPRDFIHFVKDVEKYVKQGEEDSPNVVVHCLNGYERSGLFCVVYTLLEKLDAERQVSIVNTVRRVRAQRRGSISNVEQLKFCYQCISAYSESYNVYSNFAV